jgi:hypothetical protein
MSKLIPAAGIASLCLALGACDQRQVQAGATIAVAAVSAATAPACAAIAKGKAAPATLCSNASGTLISILDYAAQNGVKTHFVSPHRLRIDALSRGPRRETQG